MPRFTSWCTTSVSLVDARVHRRVGVHRVAERADDERQVREPEALLGPEPRAVRAAHPLDRLEVDLDRGGDVRARGLRPHHVLGGAAADVVERDALVARSARALAPGATPRRAARGAGGAPGTAGGLDVAAGDAAVLAGAGDRGGVEAALGDHARARAAT